MGFHEQERLWHDCSWVDSYNAVALNSVLLTISIHLEATARKQKQQQ